MSTPSPGFSDLLRGAGLIFRPRLRIRKKGRIRDHIVPAGSTHAIYVRLWLQNYGFGQRARECSLSLDRITFEGNVIENESSPLLWTDINTHDPQTLVRGARAMMPIDLCAVYKLDGWLHVKSRKAISGELIYNQTGTYTFGVRTQALWPASNDRAFVDVYYDSDNWMALKIIGLRRKRKWTRVWLF